jgi:hypothetical protein
MKTYQNKVDIALVTGDTPRGLKPHSFSRIIVKSLLNFSELHHTLKRRREINLWSKSQRETPFIHSLPPPLETDTSERCTVLLTVSSVACMLHCITVHGRGELL